MSLNYEIFSQWCENGVLRLIFYNIFFTLLDSKYRMH